MQVLIDGDPYVKEAEQVSYSIGIGITTHNRNNLAASTAARIAELTPGARIIIVDDASEMPFNIPGLEVYRFRQNVGIARAKNKCLELLSNCEHIFLFDDDCYPLVTGWHKPYVNSAEHHLMYLFENWSSGEPVGDDHIIYEDGGIVAHDHARGCMMYVDRQVLETVGGLDTRYGKAMNEHLDWSNRIHNAGLTTFRYMDVADSDNLIHSMDEHQEVISSIPKIERRALAVNNQELLEHSVTSTEFMPYGHDLILTSYFAGVKDVQRPGETFRADPAPIRKLQHSAEYHGIDFALIHNCFDDMPNLTTISGSPYFERWLKQWQYLRAHPEVNRVFVTDATDVDMLNNAFIHLEEGKLYVGDEPGETLANTWMRSMHREPMVNQFLLDNPELPLLNCGVVGGDRKLVMEVCRDIYSYYYDKPGDQTEMGIFNYLMHTKYADRIEYGRHVTTVFKAYEGHSTAWFRHK